MRAKGPENSLHFFKILVDGCGQVRHDRFHGGFCDLRACGGCVAAAAQGLQDHLHIHRAEAPGGDDDGVAIGIEHEGGGDACDVQQIIRSLGRKDAGGGVVQECDGQLRPVKAGGLDDIVLGDGVLQIALHQLLDDADRSASAS